MSRQITWSHDALLASHRNTNMESETDIKPYQFEPLMDVSAIFNIDDNESSIQSESSSDEQENTDRAGRRTANTNWCDCELCKSMLSEDKSLCCTEVPIISDKMDEAGLARIIVHDAFHATCLNRYCVELGIITMVDQDGPLDDNEAMNETYRYVAYRQFVSWIWHHLGKGNRRVLPSCVVCKIRDTYPDYLANYVGFKYMTI